VTQLNYESATLQEYLAITGIAKTGVPPELVIASEVKQSLTVSGKIAQFR
jgi:hypothetical protein